MNNYRIFIVKVFMFVQFERRARRMMMLPGELCLYEMIFTMSMADVHRWRGRRAETKNKFAVLVRGLEKRLPLGRVQNFV